MKKILHIMLKIIKMIFGMFFFPLFIMILFICFVGITGCYQDLENNSLKDYVLGIQEHGIGNSFYHIDNADNFLPSKDFFAKYEYIEGSYYWQEVDPLRMLFQSDVKPDTSFIYLKYDKSIYQNAKEFMLKEIEPYENKFYKYNDYVFYENSNFIKENYWGREFPHRMTMVCYNDKNNTIIFLGFHSSTDYEEKYMNEIEGNWGDFIERFYGEYYNFNE